MTHVLHIVKKDVRRLRWATAAWVAVTVAGLALKTAGAELSFGSMRLRLAVGNISDVLPFVDVLLLALVVSGLVHDEPLVGADAFWLTRPIGWSRLLAAKLLFAAVFLVALPAAGESMVIAAISGDLRVTWLAAVAYAFRQAVWVSSLLAVAAVTPSIGRFLLTLAGGVAAVTAVALALVTVRLVFTSIDEAGHVEPILVDGTSGVVATLLITCAAVLVLAYQYGRRRTERAVAIGVAAIVAAVVIASYWPWRFARPAEPDPGAWAHDASLSPARLDAGVAPQTSTAFATNRSVSRKHVAAPLRLTGVPPAYSSHSIGTTTRVEFSDGTRLESAQAFASAVQLPAPESARVARLQSAFGNTQLLTSEGALSAWPVLLTVTDQEYERYGRVPGRLTAMVQFSMFRSRLMGAIPLAEHASLLDGPLFEVRRLIRRSDGCTVLVRRIRAVPLSGPSVPTQYDFVLRNAALREAVLGERQPFSGSERFALPWLSGGIWVGGESRGFGVEIDDAVVEFPGRVRGRAAATSPIDAAWLDGADLAVVETEYAGRVTRTLTVDGFTMR